MTRKEATQLLQFVQDFLGRRRDKGSELQCYLDMVVLHMALLIDMAREVDVAIVRPAVRALIALKSQAYLSVFDKADDKILELVRVTDRPRFDVFVDDLSASCGAPKQLTKLCRSLLSTSRGRTDPDAFRTLHQLFCFPLRLNLPGAERAVGGLLEINASRDGYHPSPLLKRLAEIVVNRDFCAVVRDNFCPHHGNGSTAFFKKSDIASRKISLARKDELLDRRFLHLFEGLTGFTGACDNTWFADRKMSELLPENSNRPIGRRTPSKVLSVPKSWKKQRIVAIEDCTRMWLQQGVRVGLYKAIERSPILRTIVDFERPERNRVLAQIGARNRTLSTVDLSSASDSVSYRFVKDLFKNSALWPALEILRTKCFWTEEQGLTESRIFATMGNAICFPIMTLIFALILLECWVELRLRGSARWMLNPIPSEAMLAVYGDDIVCPEWLTPLLLEKLVRYGFTPNLRKTFRGCSRFRESCGGEFFADADVTPLRVSRRFKGLACTNDAKNISALVNLANRAYGEFPLLYTVLLKALSQDFTKHVPFSTDGSIGVISGNPDESMKDYEVKWDRRHQTACVLVDWVKQEHRRCYRVGEVALCEYILKHRSPQRDVNDEVISRHIRKGIAKHYFHLDVYGGFDGQIVDPEELSSVLVGGRVSVSRHWLSKSVARLTPDRGRAQKPHNGGPRTA